MKKNYYLLLDTFQKVHGMAEKIIKKQKLKKIGNCKLMSERLVSFDVPTYINQLKDLFQKTELFFKKTYQGFYCSLCDAEMH